MTKIIFLDVDGVLNCENYYKENIERIKQSRKEANKKKKEDLTLFDIYGEDIDPVRLKMLNDTIAETNAKIVVSSTWRYGATWEAFNAILDEEKCFEIKDAIIGRTDRSTYEDHICRGNEIKKWLLDNKDKLNIPEGKFVYDYTNYIILDDDSDMLLQQKDNFFQTHWKTGLTEEICNKIKEFFKEGE